MPRQKEHDDLLTKVEQRLADNALQVTNNKCIRRVGKVNFLGDIISKNAISPDPARLESFSKIPSPTSKHQLRCVLGTLQFYSGFVQNFSACCHLFYELLKKNIYFTWTNRHEGVLRRLVDGIAAALPSTMFDSSRPLSLCCDASDKGVGAVLSHDVAQKEVVWCASRVLTKAEKNYSNIEREALSMSLA